MTPPPITPGPKTPGDSDEKAAAALACPSCNDAKSAMATTRSGAPAAPLRWRYRSVREQKMTGYKTSNRRIGEWRRRTAKEVVAEEGGERVKNSRLFYRCYALSCTPSGVRSEKKRALVASVLYSASTSSTRRVLSRKVKTRLDFLTVANSHHDQL